MRKIGEFQSRQYGKVVVGVSTYETKDGPTAVALRAEDGEPIGTLSYNISQRSSRLQSHEFYAKVDRENEMIAQDALASGMFEEVPGQFATSGFIKTPLWRIKPEFFGEKPKERNLGKVIEQLIEVVPELKTSLDKVMSSVRYSPPENMRMWWGETMEVLQAEVPPTHEKFQEVLGIFNATNKEKAEAAVT